MVFSSLSFCVGFLPLLLLVYFLCGRHLKLQNIVLLAASLLFYGWGEPRYILLFVITVLANWLLALLSVRFRRKGLVRLTGVLAISLDVALLFWFKYAGWIGSSLGLSMGGSALPLGISFYTFQAISYVADVTLKGRYAAERNPVDVGLYIAFFPQLVAGPIVRYEDMRGQIRERSTTLDGFEAGCFRFALGFCKKVLLADSMAVIVDRAFSDGSVAPSFAWLGAIAYTFQILMDFSGYSDMAIGLGALFGFRIPENFNNPYRASTIRDFWRRWHMTLSGWFRDYVYIPLGGSRGGKWKTLRNIAVVWLLTGFWHGANLTFVLWGCVYGTIVAAEKALDIEARLAGRGFFRAVYRMFTLLMIVLLWVLFRADTVAGAWACIGRMFRLSSEGLPLTVMVLNEFKWAVAGCVILSAVSTDWLMRHRTRLWPVMLVLFVVSFSYLVKGSFSPFLYFNF